MRFSVIAAAFMATVVAAGKDYTSTTSTTIIETITSCGPEVTNCPGRTHTKTYYTNSSTPVTTSTSAPYVASSSKSTPVSLSTTYITTCIPTVITSVYTVTETPQPSGTGVVTYAHNSTAPSVSSVPSQAVTGGASGLQGSAVVVAAAGLAAFLFA